MKKMKEVCKNKTDVYNSQENKLLDIFLYQGSSTLTDVYG